MPSSNDTRRRQIRRTKEAEEKALMRSWRNRPKVESFPNNNPYYPQYDSNRWSVAYHAWANKHYRKYNNHKPRHVRARHVFDFQRHVRWPEK